MPLRISGKQHQKMENEKDQFGQIADLINTTKESKRVYISNVQLLAAKVIELQHTQNTCQSRIDHIKYMVISVMDVPEDDFNTYLKQAEKKS